MSNTSQNDPVGIHRPQTLATDPPPSYNEVMGSSQTEDSSTKPTAPSLKTNTIEAANSSEPAPTAPYLENDRERTYNIGFDRVAQPSGDTWSNVHTTQPRPYKNYDLLQDNQTPQRRNNSEEDDECCTCMECCEGCLVCLSACECILSCCNCIMAIASRD